MAVSITSIPLPFRSGFAKIRKLAPVELDSLVAALEAAPRSGGLKELASAVVRQMPALGRDDVAEILRTLFSLSVLVTDEETPLAENIARLTAAMQATGSPDLALSAEEQVEFERRLQRLLLLKTVVLLSKVRRLELDYPKTFHDAMILTDLRPVFEKPEDAPVACTISHTLKITYHEDGDHKEFHVVLDSGDLEMIKKAILRAEAKTSSVKSFLKGANLPDLS